MTEKAVYELQLLDHQAGCYEAFKRGEREELCNSGRYLTNAWRVVHTERGTRRSNFDTSFNPLPLRAAKPPRQERRPSEASCYDPDALLERALAHYYARLLAGQSVTIYYWKHYPGALRWSFELKSKARALAARYGEERVQFVELDPKEPGSAFGPMQDETCDQS